MKQKFVIHEGNDRLMLIFAGWGMDDAPLRHVRRPGYDTLVVWDYRDLSADWKAVASYKEIALIAWSMGVYAASMTIHAIDHLISAKIAVNGTLTPVDNLTGIPEAVFEGTAANLNERNLQKFFRRMCGDRDTHLRFMQAPPSRPVGELVEELRAIYPEPWFSNPKVGGWSKAVIGRNDAIFPACNQQRAWAGTPTVVLDRPHYIDIQEIADAYIIDKQQAAACFNRGMATYDENATVQHAVVADLMADLSRLKPERRTPSQGMTVLEAGSGSGILSRRLAARYPDAFLHLWDTLPCAPEGVRHASFVSCDAELQLSRTPGERYDIIASASTIQWFNSPRRFISECLRTLRPGGLLLLTAFTRGNMHELSAAGAPTLPMPDEAQWLDMIPAGFEMLSMETADYDKSFETPVEVLRHLHATGVNGLGRSGQGATGPAIVRRYPRMLDGRYHLTYRTIRFILKKKDNG